MLELTLLEWDREGRPRLLGRVRDPELGEEACRQLAAERRRDLVLLEEDTGACPARRARVGLDE